MGPSDSSLGSLCDGGPWSQWTTLLIHPAHSCAVYTRVLGQLYLRTPNGWLKSTDIHPPPALEMVLKLSWCPKAKLCPESPGKGPPCLFQLPGAPGVRPWAGGRLPPVSTSVSMWLLLCIRVSPLPCLIRTLSRGLGPPPPRRTSSQTLHSITSTKTFYFHARPRSHILGVRT